MNTEENFYLEKFCKENSGCKRVEMMYPVHDILTGTRTEEIVFDDVKSALANRLKGNKGVYRFSEFGRNTYMRVLSKNFYDNGMIRRELDHGHPCFFEFIEGLSNNYSIVFDPKKMTPGNAKNDIVGNLTYDGLCAFMTLAGGGTVIQNKDVLMAEIYRNAQKEICSIDPRLDESADKIREIGEKYIELKYVLNGLCEQYVESNGFEISSNDNKEALDKISEAENDNIANSAEAYDEVMKKLNYVSASKYYQNEEANDTCENAEEQ